MKVTKAIVDEFNLDISDQYIDGTKIEANANKYKFVWKPVKFQKRLNEKIKDKKIKYGKLADRALEDLKKQ